MSRTPAAVIEFEGVHYRVDSRPILAGLDFTIAPGELFMLLGRSGSGKTTALKLINRLLAGQQGEVRVDGIPTLRWDLIRLRRHIGYAIQEIGLFPHYTVAQNVALIPKLQGWEQSRIRHRTREVLQLVGLPEGDFGARYPHQLSGGQKQRVGLARALAADPPILLMDEPFGALDPLTRAELQREFAALQQQLRKSVVFVTHSIGEALLLGTRIALLEAGSLRGIYTPREFLASTDPHVQSYVEAFRVTEQLLPER